jgi:hypothetical protein
MPYIQFEDEEDYIMQKRQHEAKYRSRFTGYVPVDYSLGFYQEPDGTIRPLTLAEEEIVKEMHEKEEKVKTRLRRLKLL